MKPDDQGVVLPQFNEDAERPSVRLLPISILTSNRAKWSPCWVAAGRGRQPLLRLIAGLLDPDRVTIAIGDLMVFGGGWPVPPERRAVDTVFEDHALWPHMSVAGNLSFALRHAG